MPVMGPYNPLPSQVDAAFNDVMKVLKEKHGVQTTDATPFWAEDRDHRNAKLMDAIFDLLQLESWESF